MQQDYLYLRAWAVFMEYTPEELEEYLAQARAEKAPERALFPMRVSGHWHTTDILAPDMLEILERMVKAAQLAQEKP